jgi:hypothetical protein
METFSQESQSPKQRQIRQFLSGTDNAEWRLRQARSLCGYQNGGLGEAAPLFMAFSRLCLDAGEFVPAGEAYAIATGVPMPHEMLRQAMTAWSRHMIDRYEMDPSNAKEAVRRQMQRCMKGEAI